MGASWAVLSRRNAEKKQMPKSFKNVKEINGFALFGRRGAISEASWAVLSRRKLETARMRTIWKHLRQITDLP